MCAFQLPIFYEWQVLVYVCLIVLFCLVCLCCLLTLCSCFFLGFQLGCDFLYVYVGRVDSFFHFPYLFYDLFIFLGQLFLFLIQVSNYCLEVFHFFLCFFLSFLHCQADCFHCGVGFVLFIGYFFSSSCCLSILLFIWKIVRLLSSTVFWIFSSAFWIDPNVIFPDLDDLLMYDLFSSSQSALSSLFLFSGLSSDTECLSRLFLILILVSSSAESYVSSFLVVLSSECSYVVSFFSVFYSVSGVSVFFSCVSRFLTVDYVFSDPFSISMSFGYKFLIVLWISILGSCCYFFLFLFIIFFSSSSSLFFFFFFFRVLLCSFEFFLNFIFSFL